MKLFKKKLDPEELKTRLMLTDRRLEKREEHLRATSEDERTRAKKELEVGNDRGFRVAARKYALFRSQAETIANMREMVANIRTVLEVQEGLKEVVEIGSELKMYQDRLGVDSRELEQAITSLRISSERVRDISRTLSDTMDAISTGAELPVMESLRTELMAEIEPERTREKELKEKLESA